MISPILPLKDIPLFSYSIYMLHFISFPFAAFNAFFPSILSMFDLYLVYYMTSPLLLNSISLLLSLPFFSLTSAFPCLSPASSLFLQPLWTLVLCRQFLSRCSLATLAAASFLWWGRRRSRADLSLDLIQDDCLYSPFLSSPPLPRLFLWLTK